MFLASVCVFVTTYNLILPAISVEKNNVGNVAGLYLDDADINNGNQDTSDEPASDGEMTHDTTIHMQKTTNGNSERSVNVYELSAVGDTYETVVTFDDKAGIPDGARLEVQEITQDSEALNSNKTTKYDEYIDNTSDTLGLSAGLISYARVFDISIVKDGEKVEPQGRAIDVRFELQDAEEESELNVVNFSDGADKGRIVENSADGNTIEFAADGPSVYVIVGTSIEKNVLASDGKNYKVTLTYGAEAGIPEGAELEVEEILPGESGGSDDDQDEAEGSSVYGMSYEKYVTYTENALGMEEGSAGYIRLFDIKIVDEDDHSVKYQPAEGTVVDVRIELADKDSSEEAAASTQVVHFADGSELPDVIEFVDAEGTVVSFEANGFSIYAITDSSKRLQYNFYDGTSLLVSEYIKKQDNVLQELYDPGVEPEYGQTFTGWAYSPNETNPSNIYTIEELNQQAAARYNSATEELTEVNVYAIYDEAWYLRYMDQDAEGNGTVLNVVRVRKDAADKNVTINYTYTPEEGIVFEGWMDVATGQTYQYGDTLNLVHHVDLYVKLQGRNWLVFDSNAGGPGSGATYTPPQLLIGSEATTTKPDDPTRRGYTFTGWNTKADGTGTWWYKTDDSVNLFGNTLSADTTLYAQWEADDTDYYVVFWRQKASDEAGLDDSEKTYDYIESVRRTALTDSSVSLSGEDTKKNNGEYLHCTFNPDLSQTTATVNADGTTVLNVYYDRETYILTFDVQGGSGTRYKYTPVTNDNGSSTIYGYVDGEWKQLSRTSQTSTTWYLRYIYSAYNYGGYRIHPDTHTYTSRNNVSSGQRYSRGDGSVTTSTYTGTRYSRSGNNYYNYTYAPTEATTGTLYGVDSNGGYVELSNASVTTYTYTYNDNGVTKTYSGPIYTRTQVTNNSNWWTYHTITALYDHSIADQFPITWKNGTRWLDYNGTYYASDQVLVSIDKMPAANIVFRWSDPQTRPTKTMNYYVQALDEETEDYQAGVYGAYPQSSKDTGNTSKETDYSYGGSSYSFALYDQIKARYNMVTELEDFIEITGFTRWTSDPRYVNGIALNDSSRDGTINMYYTRNKYAIHYISQGPNVTERSEKQDDLVYYEASLAPYGLQQDDSWYYEPTNGKEGYFFAGWYEDEACTVPYDFNTQMPANDITVYAKWDTYRVRVVLVPTPNNAHNDEVELANNQSLSFRLDYNEEVSDANINSSVVKRPGYKLIGWYYSPDFDPNTEIHFPLVVNKDTPGVDMNYQTGEDWSRYGDNDGSHDNVKGILKLYAKWELDVDESSVYVEYDVDDVYRTYDTAGMLQTTIPVDDNKYALTNNNVTFQVAEAPTEYTAGFEFYRWVLLNPDGSESSMELSPSEMANDIPSSYIYEETITDDLGNTATIKKIRLKAKFNIEPEKVTTVTFDGNGGVTNDSAQQERVTESYPINKDFLMKDEDSFVREGYTLLGWAFEREDGTKITAEAYKNAIATMTADELIQAGIYQLGQEVAADNLEVSGENNWNPLENTVYAVWEINKYTVTVKKIVDGDSEGKTFSFTAATTSESYTILEDDTSFLLADGGEKPFLEVPYGTVLTFLETPASGFSIQSVDAKQTTLPDKTALEDAAYIDLGGAEGKAYTIKGNTVITYTNEKAKEQKLRIHKIGDDAAEGLAGASFSLTSSDADGFNDKTGLVSMDNTVPANLGYLPSGETDNTVFTIPIGTYTLAETTAPQYYDSIAGAVTLSVTGEGISITSVGDDAEAPFEGVDISRSDTDGVYTLTVTNTRKKANVTVIKNVTGTDADKDAQYSFTATGLTAEEDAFSLYGQHKDAAGTTPEQKNTKVYEDISHGTLISVAESDEYSDFTTTITATYIDSDGATQTITLDPERDNKLSIGEITVNGDVTITYTNTRNKQPVAIYKTGIGDDETITTGATFALYKASEYNDDTLTANDGATVVAYGTTNERGILIFDKLSIEPGAEYTEYRLVETDAPAGYVLPDYLMKIFVYPDKVIGMQGTGNMLIKDAENYSDIADKSTTVLRVWNNPGVSLPSTGGPGTNFIYLIGSIMLAFAGAGLAMRRRRRA